MKDFYAFAIENAGAEFQIIVPFRVVCAWCGKVLQEGAADAAISHSICDTCSEQLKEDDRD